MIEIWIVIVLLALMEVWSIISIRKILDLVHKTNLEQDRYAADLSSRIHKSVDKLDFCESRIEQIDEDIKPISEVLNGHDMLLTTLSSSIEKLHKRVRKLGAPP